MVLRINEFHLLGDGGCQSIPRQHRGGATIGDNTAMQAFNLLHANCHEAQSRNLLLSCMTYKNEMETSIRRKR